MKAFNLDREWFFGFGPRNPFQPGISPDDKMVNLPHDYMIGTETFPDAPAKGASGFYTAGVAHYMKKVMIPAEWKNDLVFLCADGIMMNATIEVNGSKAALQHYGYAPFCTDITPYLYFGEENHLTITVNPSMQPNSRWYSGAGIFRSLTLMHAPKVYIANDGIFVYTKDIEFDEKGNAVSACLNAEVEIVNRTDKNQIVKVTTGLCPDTGHEDICGGSGCSEESCCSGNIQNCILSRSARIQVNPGKTETAHLTLTVDSPALWDVDTPNLYKVCASVTIEGEYRTHFIPAAPDEITSDSQSVLFGIRRIQADVKHGLRINGHSVKLKGGCLHHDNGPLGAVSLYDAEMRKLSILKSIGYNAVRTTHNPPSAAFMEACDRLGIYVFDEAFDTWGMGKMPGDYNQFFETDWPKDLTAFIKRDRCHPSVIIWSTGNEITERAGLGNGYTLAAALARTFKSLDPSRPVSNAICSFWNGLDDAMTEEMFRKMQDSAGGDLQNASVEDDDDTSWQDITEPFTNGLDIVGYNYLEEKYKKSHEMFPERIILGSENFGWSIGIHWPMIESTPYVIGDFTWTAFDYIGEAGIGKSLFVEPDDPILKQGLFALQSHVSSYPWRLANDADVDICGNILPQGIYRRIVWGSKETAVFSYDPASYGKTEMISRWGFTGVLKCWNFEGMEGKPVKTAVFSRGDAVELFVNGVSFGIKKAGESQAFDMPCTFIFDAVYQPGTLEAVSYMDGVEISRDRLSSAGKPAALRLMKESIPCAAGTDAAEDVSSLSGVMTRADGHRIIYIKVEVVDEAGNVVPDAALPLSASVEGSGFDLAAFGSGNPITDENYTSGSFRSYRGRALAVVRTTYDEGEAVLTIHHDTLGDARITLSSRS